MPDKSDKPRDPTKVVALQVRMREEVRAELQQAAKVAGRPMNTEIVERLERSLHDEGIFDSPANRRLFSALATAVATAEAATGEGWQTDVATHEATRRLVERVFLESRPPAPNQNEIDEAWDAYFRAQVEAYSRARVLEENGVLTRRANALASLALDHRDPTDPMQHSGDYDPERYAEVMFAHQIPTEKRPIAAAIQYFKLSPAIDLRANPEEWHITNARGEKVDEHECIALNMYLKGLPTYVEEAVKAREAFHSAFKPKADALKRGNQIVEALIQAGRSAETEAAVNVA